MTKPVTLASLRPHGVRQLLVYCQGKREGDWPCHHQGTLPVERFRPNIRASHIGPPHLGQVGCDRTKRSGSKLPAWDMTDTTTSNYTR
jgi:hypothetical protein